MINNDLLVDILQDRGYDARSAKLVAPELMSLTEPLNEYLDIWLGDEHEMKDYSIEGCSVLTLMEDRGMTYPAALLTLDWLIKEPDFAKESLARGLK